MQQTTGTGNRFAASHDFSNLIVDQTENNPAAYAAAYDPGADGILHTADDVLKDGVESIMSPAPGRRSWHR
ncbi:MAG: hypothetical protein M0C28_31840 [Candidatus Moduliflexus flocculans]|nr:hypothetical protein [Candidatus Moduliflexus flocculans]